MSVIYVPASYAGDEASKEDIAALFKRGKLDDESVVNVLVVLDEGVADEYRMRYMCFSRAEEPRLLGLASSGSYGNKRKFKRKFGVPSLFKADWVAPQAQAQQPIGPPKSGMPPLPPSASNTSISALPRANTSGPDSDVGGFSFRGGGTGTFGGSAALGVGAAGAGHMSQSSVLASEVVSLSEQEPYNPFNPLHQQAPAGGMGFSTNPYDLTAQNVSRLSGGIGGGGARGGAASGTSPASGPAADRDPMVPVFTWDN